MFGDNLVTSFTYVPIKAFVDAKQQPEMIFDRGIRETWYTNGSHITEPHFTWLLYNIGDLVRIPLWAYVTTDASLSVLTAYSFELGIRALMARPSLVSKEPLRLHIAIGDEVEEIVNEIDDSQSYRFFIGFGLLTETGV